jgi:predicted amidohydrolase
MAEKHPIRLRRNPDRMPEAGRGKERPMRITVVSVRLTDPASTIEERLEDLAGLVREAGDRGSELVVFPEHCGTHGTRELERGTKRSEFAESVPGRFCQCLGQAAMESGIAVAAGILEREEERFFNTVIIIRPDGKPAGVARKTHPTASEVRTEGVIPGKDLPVFRFLGCTLGVMNCMDVYFPEVARVLALRGAGLILWPTMAHGPTAEQLLMLCRSRAIENGAWIASANYAYDPPYAPYADRAAMGRAFVMDPDGTIVADTGHRPGTVTTDIELAEPRRTVGVVGFRRSGRDVLPEDLFAMRRPDVYGEICEPIDNSDYLEGREKPEE